MLAAPWVLLATASPLAAQNPAKPAAGLAPAGAPGENVVKSEAPPADLIPSARAAVEKLSNEVVAERYQIAIDRMYPQWKERMAKREGGMEKLDAKLQSAPQILKRNGVILLSSKPQGEARVYEVVPGKRIEKIGGRDVEVLGYTKWLVFVPTVTRMKVFKDSQAHVIESTSFQAAITDKGKYDWTFIDGSSASQPDFRSLFRTLPGDLVLPVLGGREIPAEPQR